MSSSTNNSLTTAQPVSSGPSGIIAKQQQQPQRGSYDQGIATSSKRSQQGRGGRRANRVNLDRQVVDMKALDNISKTVNSELSVGNLESFQPVASSSPSSSNAAIARNPDISNTSHGRLKSNQKAPRSSGASGKYKQRHQTRQLIDGMDGLDIDLVESIAPTNRANDSGKGRHAIVTRKMNLNHLLNYERKQSFKRSPYTPSYHCNRGNQNQAYYNDSNHVHKFNKQQFLQANCQFVVLPFHDYTIHKVDPDWPVDWNCIEEVKFKQTGTTETTCPICLEPPISAKITKCGHIYCWTCMLHYLSLSDERSRPCPICFESISECDLRSVVSQLYPNHAVEEEIVMRLMIRKRGCVEIELYQGNAETSSSNRRMDNPRLYGSDANLLIVDPATIICEVVNREQAELLMKLECDRDEPEVCFIEQAMDRLTQRIERLQKLITDPPKHNKSSYTNNVSVDLSSSKGTEKSFLFYQSSDGQHIYLNPFSTKILSEEYGSLENCPLEIRAKILQMDWISMNEWYRKRFKYLEHLPLTCEFRLIEIDFENSNLVKANIFATFADQIRLRANDRAIRKIEEQKRDKIIQIEQNRRIYGIQPSLNINLDSLDQFPAVFDENRSDQVISPTNTGDTIRTDDNTINQLGYPEETSDEEQPEPETSLSFKEIQMRQEAAEAKTHKSSKIQPVNQWTKSKSGAQSTSQSSFAKLLVGAKSSQEQWTSKVKRPTNGSIAIKPVLPNHRLPSISQDSDDPGEELRAPPCAFTIGDFLKPARTSKKSGKKNH